MWKSLCDINPPRIIRHTSERQSTGHHQMRPNNRDSILRAAETLVLQRGAAALTLEEVAATANMSKGGLLYHFKTKDQLVHELLEFAFANFEAAVDRMAEQDRTPGGWLRAYVRATFETDPTTEAESLASAALVVAYFGRDASVRKLYEDALSRWSNRAKNDGIDRATADVIRMATDGLWLADALGVSGFSKIRKRAFVNRLLMLVD
ncbi:TetR/AcrR family transcriptional regulator [Paraburkholderia podalyriae]|uniref:TetR/AcrR family transcriptional regulator n=1 Tax=Paraburkholderia podalyriae TaxID=1938811 RepID=A0ABR7Q2J0_9BURK|nr:TetR/AcrR family transcriptional regulator [Paraburkholderia podalyriae]MBC8752775.1 TetR/AcrR family transcriptional regulator [Paraburkholderia podalyriae]